MARPKQRKGGSIRGRKPYFKNEIWSSGGKKKTVKKCLVKQNTGQNLVRQNPVQTATELTMPSEVVETDQPTLVDLFTAPTRYQSVKEREVSQWRALREPCISAFVEELSPACSTCTVCECRVDKIIRCFDCSCIYFCEECFHQTHQWQMLHVPEIWEDGRFKKYISIWSIKRPDHVCNHSYFRQIVVVDSKGRFQNLNFNFCLCENECVTLIRYRFWPASPLKPSLVFHMDLMLMLRALQLEGHLSMQAFCEAIKLKNNLMERERKWLYRLLVSESYEEFRHFYHTVNNKESFCSEWENCCPACPKKSDTGNLIVSLDGNFGLVRKKNSGRSCELPKHQEAMFICDRHVDHFVNNYYEDEKQINEDCNSFKAGSKIRAKNKAAMLDITGIFGGICRHDIPLKFVNLRHGERLAYPMMIVEEILEGYKDSQVNIIVMYDIACILEAHLRKIKLAIPIFHCYGHRGRCQTVFNPRNLDGCGLSDGENMERLWSYLRGFSKTTKEMTPSHRIDVLSDALINYKQKKLANIESSLADRAIKAQKIYTEAGDQIQELLGAQTVAVSSADVAEWQRTEALTMNERRVEKENNLVWQETYVDKLVKHSIIRHQMHSCTDPDTSSILLSKKDKLNSTIVKLEDKYNVSARWSAEDDNYLMYFNIIEEKQKKKILEIIRAQCIERHFLMSLRRKYSDGQAVAIRISRQISKVSIIMKRNVKQYNDCKFAAKNCTLPNSLAYTEVSSPTSGVFLNLEKPAGSSTSHVPELVKRQVIDCTNLQKRAKEEIDFVQQEMVLVFCHLNKNLECVRKRVSSIPETSRQNIGIKAFLRSLEYGLITRKQDMHSCFSQHVELPDDVVDADTTLSSSAISMSNENADEDIENAVVEAIVAYEDRGCISEDDDNDESDSAYESLL